MPAKPGETNAYRILPDGTVNELLIEDQWEDMLRLMVSLKLKQVTAWQVLKRLSAYTRRHPIYRALCDYLVELPVSIRTALPNQRTATA